MNLVQRIVADNLQSVTSKEIAESSDIPHGDLCKWLDEHRDHLERYGVFQIAEDNIVLNDKQALLAICMLPGLSSSDKVWELSLCADDLVFTNLAARRNERSN